MNSKVILFFSFKCPHSIELINKIKQINEFEKYFNLISLEKRKDLFMKYKVKQIPFIIIENKSFTGNECFSWVEYFIKKIEESERPKFSAMSSHTDCAAFGTNSVIDEGNIYTKLDANIQMCGDRVDPRAEQSLDELVAKREDFNIKSTNNSNKVPEMPNWLNGENTSLNKSFIK